MGYFVIWECCNCRDCGQTPFVEICSSCHHQKCEHCENEFHRDGILSYDLRSPLDSSTDAEPEDVFFDLDAAADCDGYDENLIDDIDLDKGCPFEQSHVAFNSLDLRTIPQMACGNLEIDRVPQGPAEMEIDPKHEEEEEEEEDLSFFTAHASIAADFPGILLVLYTMRIYISLKVMRHIIVS